MLRCLIATLGKDAPGTNAAVRAATRFALRSGMDVFGAKRGLAGIVAESFHKMKEADVAFILGRGGSILGSSDFRVSPSDKATLVKIARVLRKFDVVVATGGLGSFAILNLVYAYNNMGLSTTMFIPASVENDFLNPYRESEETETTEPEAKSTERASAEPPFPAAVHAESIGADTAANTGVDAIDRLREQSYLSRTVFLVQCAGAKSNYLPITIGMACGAHRVYLPQYPRVSPEGKAEIQRLYGESFDPNTVNVSELVGWVEQRFEVSKKTYLVVIIPHGIPMVNLVHAGTMADSTREDYESIIMSTAPMELTVPRIVDDLMIHFGGSGLAQVRYLVLDDLQRGGSPTARDRLLGSLYGRAAVELYLSAVDAQDVQTWGNLNLVAVEDPLTTKTRTFRRQQVAPIFQGTNPRAGGLDPLPFFRQSRGTASGYAPLMQP